MHLPTMPEAAEQWVAQRIVAAARSRADSLAVVMGPISITYRELDRQSNRLANELVARGICKGSLVGIAVERSIGLIISVLAVLKCGAAYAAIDPTYPTDRVTAMCSAIPLSLLITTEQGLGMRPPFGAPRLHLDRDGAGIDARPDRFDLVETGPNDLVYVVFTSGSTGVPKAAAVHQAGWANLMQWFVSEFDLVASDRNLIVSSFSFDITQRSIVMPLLVGGQLHLFDGHAIDSEGMASVIHAQNITLMNCAPSAFYPLAESGSGRELLTSLRWLFLGGEPISASRIQAWAEGPQTGTRVVNVYGTAECSDVSSFHILTSYENYVSQGVPAGKPIPNTEIFLLNEAGAPVPDGDVGEIVITGVGVGKGYINDPAMTAARFEQDWREPTMRIYRTGDLGRWSPGVGLQFIGRADNQVKIRGNRLDLGDVETSLRQDVRIRDAVAVKHVAASGMETLVAFLLLEEPHADNSKIVEDIRKAMARRVPSFMVPSCVQVVDAFPLNPNGKVNRKQMESVFLSAAVLVPDDEMSREEVAIAEILQQILDVGHIGRDSNFFDLGGYSALVTEALSEINNHFDSAVTIYDFLNGPTVGDLAACVEQTRSKQETVRAH
ncbi:amino acid adenylation domain-containing protein [Rhizobium sp. NPDC090279]|uniref:non-ribosomal peptide synthetase n=1 Tax=Rhizobium sp. NPDC090279 TaxID=3364499 RepID=UPI00383A9589